MMGTGRRINEDPRVCDRRTVHEDYSMGSVLAAVVDLDWRSCQQRTVHRLACCRGRRKESTLALSSGGRQLQHGIV